MKIPVFHDDQHGTSIIVGAAVINGLRVVEKEISKVKVDDKKLNIVGDYNDFLKNSK